MTTAAAISVVLVHGGFVDGSGWEGVYQTLKKDGYAVSIVQNPTLSLADDVAATRLVLAAQDGPVILVGHSYGGVVITEAGTDPKVAGLVYIAAFAPDTGESVASLIKDPPPGRRCRRSCRRRTAIFPRPGEVPRLLRGRRGRRTGGVHGRLAGAVGRGGPQRHGQRAGVEDQAELVSGRHRGPDDPTAGPALHGRAGGIDGGRGPGSHAIYVSRPDAVAALIKAAATGVNVKR